MGEGYKLYRLISLQVNYRGSFFGYDDNIKVNNLIGYLSFNIYMHPIT